MKRLLDVAAASAILVMTAPLLFAAMIAIWLGDRHSPIFRQQRAGRNNVPFEILKLRTMSPDTPDVASSDAHSVTITPVGRVVRRLNIDELPQLICILRGDMSLVGPRPALLTQQRLLTLRKENGAAAVTPGLTGLAQLRAYDDMPEDEKAAHDGEYAASANFWLDVKLLLRTASYLLKPPPQY